MPKILLTGGAGFIGASVAKKLLEAGEEVVIVDNLNDYYDPQLKNARLKLVLDAGEPCLPAGREAISG